MDKHVQKSGATFGSPPRLARKNTLNTIMEDRRGERRAERREQKEEEPGEYIETRYWTNVRPGESSPVPSLTSSISSYYFDRHSGDFSDSINEVSDIESNASSIMTDLSSIRSTSHDEPPPSREKPKCPLLVIPTPSFWPAVPRPPPDKSPPRPPKIPLSPANLSMLGYDLPTASNPPSLAGSLSTDPNNSYSGPSTPDSQTNARSEDIWGENLYSTGIGDPSLNGTMKRPPRPKITVDTGGKHGPGPGISPREHISMSDFASPYFPDSPILGSEDEVIQTGIGVELPFDALVTLHHLSLEGQPPGHSEDGREMKETSSPVHWESPDGSPASHVSEYSLSQFSIPSPSNFFTSLDNSAQHTWHIGSLPVSALPPSSTTAEQFYKCPWNLKPPLPTGHGFESGKSALKNLDGSNASISSTVRQYPSLERRKSRFGSLYPAEIHEEYGTPPMPPLDQKDEAYDVAIQDAMEKNIDRTTDWLAMQTSYLAALRETNPVNDLSARAESDLRRYSSHLRKDALGTPITKAVRFLESETAKHEYQTPKTTGLGDPIYYHAFQHIRSSWRKSDAFRHRLTRSDSIQSVRLCLPQEHVKRLKGEYHISPPLRPNPRRPISLMPDKQREADDETAEQKLINQVERERQALEQMEARAWIIEASKYLQGGSLLSSPARWKTIRTPKLGDIQGGRVLHPARVLDLGGQPHGDWAWHCAREFPHARVYTATPDSRLLGTAGGGNNIRGPGNHRKQLVQNLYRLPFPDHHFHAISARSLHQYLKVLPPIPPDPDNPATPHMSAGGGGGIAADEYDLCLHECLRVLKPGGYLEFFLMDAEVVSPGPLGTKASVEFVYNLRTKGYDPAPTKPFLGRLKRAGYDDIKRAWTFLPMGSPTKASHELPETPPPDGSAFVPGTCTDATGRPVEAVHGPVGSTADVAQLSGLVGSWAWEQWMLRLETEMAKEKVLQGVGGVLEEGKYTGAGWRCLRGWARKPLEMNGRQQGGVGGGGGGDGWKGGAGYDRGRGKRHESSGGGERGVGRGNEHIRYTGGNANG